MILGIVLGVLFTLLVVNAIADHRAGVWDRERPQRLDITDALKRQDRIKVLRDRRPEAN